MRLTKSMKTVETQKGKPIRDLLIDMYEKHGSQTAVAAELGITQSTLSRWLINLRLRQRTILEDEEVKP